jgi:zinc transporter ZupT
VFWSLVAAGAATASAAVPETNSYSPDRTWIKAAAICILHLLATQIRPLLQDRAKMVSSFGGGMAVSYVFANLIPELGEGHEVVGELIYLFVLVGFVVYYGLESRISRSQPTARGGDHRSNFMLSLGSYWMYNWLIVFGLPDGPSVSAIHVSLMTVAIGLHLLHSDYDIGSEYPEMFNRWGRFVVACAPLIGLLCRFYFRPDGELVKDLLTAVLAGSVVYCVFKKELPNPERSSFKWFFVGIVVYTFLLVMVKQV